jgi:hypothetical protein
MADDEISAAPRNDVSSAGCGCSPGAAAGKTRVLKGGQHEHLCRVSDAPW